MQNYIDQIISSAEQDEEDIILEIGVAVVHEYAPSGRRYKAQYGRIGKELWESVQYKLYKAICDTKTKQPKFVIEELISGDIRDFGVSILTILVSQLSIPVAIAVPISSLVLKSGINKFCKTSIKRAKKSIKEILSTRKRQYAGTKKRNPSSP